MSANTAPIAPQEVLIFDTTLRDGAQSPGINLNVEQSLAIAHQLERLGVNVIEAGFPISSAANFVAVQAVAQEVQGPVIAGLARANAEDIDRAAEAVRDSERPRIHTFVSTSDIHIEHQMQSTRADVKGLARAAVAQAKEHVYDVEFSPMDATRSDVEFTAEVVQIAIDEGATTINIPDTVGYATPDEYGEFLGKLYKLVPSLGGVVVSVHCHNDLGLAVANSLAGVQAGARQIECAINGLGERAGNAALEEVVMMLRLKGERYGVHVNGIDTTQIGPTSRMVSRHTGYTVQPNKAVVGRNAFQHESGIHQSGVLNNRSTFEIMESAEVGMATDGIVLGKQSGRAALSHVLEQEGVLNPQYLKPTFELLKDLGDQIGGVSTEQAVALHEEAERRQTGHYKLEALDVTKQDRTYTARVKVGGSGSSPVEAAASEDSTPAESKVDGAVSAIFQAIKETTGTDYQLKDYSTRSIGEGQKTVGESTVRLQINGHTVVGKGLSTDVLHATAWAYLNALGKAEAA